MTARLLALGLALAATLPALPAFACGGFFCSRQPVDQLAERVIFAVNVEAGTTDMIVQIQYSGAAEDFAWVVPLGAVPEEGSLDTFPLAAMVALDANTVPRFDLSGRCFAGIMPGIDSATPDSIGGVTVHTREEVGPYDAAVVSSDDPGALTAWLRDNGFRVTSAMEPYIGLYSREGRPFLALRLAGGADIGDIEPFRMRLPGTSPGIPLRMTALAAEPEMAILVTVLGSQRYEGANWPNLEVPAEQVMAALVDEETFRVRFTWPAAVARSVDEAGGRGWVTESAWPTAELLGVLRRTEPADAEQAEAIAALEPLLAGHPYLTRLYTRLSPEEMTSDPIFRRSDGGDIDLIESGFYSEECAVRDPEPCDFLACGAGGRCAEVDETTAGCACVPGATARTTVGPDGFATVSCIDRTMSFVSPGDRETPDDPPLPDPCVGFDCGAGTCVPVNMTPTCECDRGAVAVGSLTPDGTRLTSCVAPLEAIPETFYEQRLPERAPLAPGYAVGGGGLGCAVRPDAAPSLAWLALLGMLLWRRRR